MKSASASSATRARLHGIAASSTVIVRFRSYFACVDSVTTTHSTGVRPYACEHCDKSYCRKVTLSKHYDKCHHPRRFALEHEALKAEQTASIERRREQLVRSVDDPQQTQLREADSQGRARSPLTRDEARQREPSLGPVRTRRPSAVIRHEQRRAPVAPRQGRESWREVYAGEISRETSQQLAPTLSKSAHCPRTTAAYTSRYPLDDYGHMYEVDEYGAFIGSVTVHPAGMPPRGAYSPGPSRVEDRFPSPSPARYGFDDTTFRYVPRPYLFHSLAPVSSAYEAGYDPRPWTPDEYAVQYARATGFSGQDWGPIDNGVPTARLHARGDPRGSSPALGADWQPAASNSNWPPPPLPSVVSGLYRLPNPAQTDLRVRPSSSVAVGHHRMRVAATSANVPHGWDLDNNRAAFSPHGSTSGARVLSPLDGERLLPARSQWSQWPQGPAATAPLPLARFPSLLAEEPVGSAPEHLDNRLQATSPVATPHHLPPKFPPSPLATPSRPPSSLSESRRPLPVPPVLPRGQQAAVATDAIRSPSGCPPKVDGPPLFDQRHRESSPPPA